MFLACHYPYLRSVKFAEVWMETTCNKSNLSKLILLSVKLSMTTYAGMALWGVCRHFGFEMIFYLCGNSTQR
jgi:hypothetical protein